MASIFWFIMVWLGGVPLIGAFRCFKAGLIGEGIYRLIAATGVAVIMVPLIVFASI